MSLKGEKEGKEQDGEGKKVIWLLIFPKKWEEKWQGKDDKIREVQNHGGRENEKREEEKCKK